MARRALTALAIGVMLVAPELRAAAPGSLEVEVNVCPGVALDAEQASRAVRAELDTDGVVLTSAPLAPSTNEGTLSIAVGCDAAISTSIRLQATGSGRKRERRIVLSDAPPSARLGVLAVSASELVRSDWVGLTAPDAAVVAHEAQYPLEPSPRSVVVNPRPAPAPAPAPVAAKTPAVATSTFDRGRRDDPEEARVPWTFAGSAQLRWFVDYGSVSFGGGTHADWEDWRLGAEALLASSDDSLGSAALGSAAARIGYRLVQKRIGPLSLSGYPMAAVGVTWMRGSAATADVRVTPATGPYADLRLVSEASLTRSRLSPTLTAELGRASGFVARSGGRAVAASGGFFFSVSVGARY